MPFYEYQCAACKAHHEELQKVTARPLRKCPACGKSALRRLMSAPAFRLKGGGWYETDFKADKDQQRNLAGEKEPAPAAAAPADKSKEAKPEVSSKEKTEQGGSSTADAKPKAASEKSAQRRKSTAQRRARK